MDPTKRVPLNPDLVVLLVAVLLGHFMVGARNSSIPIQPQAIYKPGPCHGAGSTSIYVPALHRCCSVCPVGSGVTRPCTKDSDSECTPCPPGHYSPTADHEKGCYSCPHCPANSHEVHPCSPVAPTACECDPGYFNDSKLGICERCTFCEHGFGALASCTPNRNTVCERCPNGTFSDVLAMDAPCRSCRNCTKAQLMTSPCTHESNFVCEEHPDCSYLSFSYIIANDCEYKVLGWFNTLLVAFTILVYMSTIVIAISNCTKRAVLHKLKAKTVTTIENGKRRTFFEIDAIRIDVHELFPVGRYKSIVCRC